MDKGQVHGEKFIEFGWELFQSEWDEILLARKTAKVKQDLATRYADQPVILDMLPHIQVLQHVVSNVDGSPYTYTEVKIARLCFSFCFNRTDCAEIVTPFGGIEEWDPQITWDYYERNNSTRFLMEINKQLKLPFETSKHVFLFLLTCFGEWGHWDEKIQVYGRKDVSTSDNL